MLLAGRGRADLALDPHPPAGPADVDVLPEPAATAAPVLRPLAMAAKAPRRVVLAGGVLTFLFENRDTVRYQVQEMMRTERIVKEADILHELHTYNELLGGPGELGCTLLIGIDDANERTEKLAQWLAPRSEARAPPATARNRAATTPPR